MNRHKVTKAPRETLLILLLPQDCVSSWLEPILKTPSEQQESHAKTQSRKNMYFFLCLAFSRLCVSIFEMTSNLFHALSQYRTAETIVFGSHVRRIVAPACIFCPAAGT